LAVVTTDPTDLARHLDRARLALGLDPARVSGGLRLVGAGEILGLAARWQCDVHGDGRAVEQVTSRLPSTRGFDGARGWAVDHSGMRGPLDLGDLELFRVTTDVLSGRWLLPESAVEVCGARVVSERIELDLRARDGVTRYRLALDRRTALPVELAPATGPPWRTRYARFEVGGWGRVARDVTFECGHLADRITITSAERCEDIDARVPALPYEVMVDSAASERVAVTRSSRGRLPLVRPRINGEDVGPFLFDTGASVTAIGADVADRLGLASRGRSWVTTSDGGTGACHRVGRRFQLGPVVVREPVMLELDLRELRHALGAPLAGVVGYDLFARSLVELRDAGRSLAVRSPDATSAGDVRWVPLRFEERCPMLPCATEQGEGLFALDTGSASPVTLYTAAVSAWGLVSARARPGSLLRGASGTRAIAMRTLPWFSVGGERFEKVRAALWTSRDDIGGTPGRLGTVGWPLLRGLDLVFDYQQSRVGVFREGSRALKSPAGTEI
jgi:predicted aspartyl protease